MRTELRYALILVLFEIVRLFTEMYLGLQGARLSQSWWSMMLLILVVLWVIYWAVNDNLATSTQKDKPVLIGAKTGFFVLLIAGACMAAIHYIFFRYVHPDYFQNLIHFAEGEGLSSTQLEQVYNLPNHLRLFIFYPSYGLLLGSIFAFFVKKRYTQDKSPSI